MKKLKYIIIIPLVILVSGILFYQTTREDMLSEPTLKIYVDGMDTADYWMDLLIKEDDIGYKRDFAGRILDSVTVLEEYSDDEGYHPAMLGGSKEEFIGRLDGFLVEDGSFRHEYWGEGIPDEFKVIIQTRDEKLIISDAVKTSGYHSEVRFDIGDVDFSAEVQRDAGEIREVLPWVRLVFSFLVRLIAAVIIKTTIAEAFGFNSKQSAKLVLITTIITQTVINVLLISQVFYGARFAFNVLYAASLAVLGAEAVLYALKLPEKSTKMRVIYTLAANAASFIMGYFIIYFVEWVSF